MSIAVCAHCGGPVVTFASMCPHCGHRGSGHGSVTVGNIPLFGSRHRGMLGRVARRLATVVLIGMGAAALFLLSHLSRPVRTHQADDKEEQCRLIQETYEAYPGELSDCLARLSYLKAVERAR